jgi:hypothetical protein
MNVFDLIDLIGIIEEEEACQNMQASIIELGQYEIFINLAKENKNPGWVKETMDIEIQKINVMYGTNFVCKDDEDYHNVIFEAKKYLSKQIEIKVKSKMEETLVKSALKRLI